MRNKVASTAADLTRGCVVITFEDGKVLEVFLNDCPREIVDRLAVHGLRQKLTDAYSGSQGNVKWAYEQAKRVREDLIAGQWTSKGGNGNDLVKALVRLSGKEEDDVVELVKHLSKDDIDRVKKMPDVAVMLDEIRLERKKARAAQGGGFDFAAFMDEGEGE